MSKTDKTRPAEVAAADPLNRHLLHWKRITSCKSSRDRCCYKWRGNQDKRSEKLAARKELRNLAVEDFYVY